MNNWYDVACMSNLSDGAKLLYIRLCGYEAHYSKVCPTIEQLTQDLGKSNKTVIKYIQELKDANLLTVTQQQSKTTVNASLHNVYHLHPENIPESEWNTSTIKSKLKIFDGTKKVSTDNQIEQLFNDYTANDELYNTLMDFVEYRREKNKILTMTSAKKILEKLNECKTDENKIKTLNKTMENGWTSIYPENNSSNKSKQPPASFKGQEVNKVDSSNRRRKGDV